MSLSQSLSQMAKIVLLALLLTLGTNYLVAWVGPTGLPPQNNVDAPLHVGTLSQVKNGALGVNALTVYGDQLILGSLQMNSTRITNVGLAQATGDAITKQYLQKKFHWIFNGTCTTAAGAPVNCNDASAQFPFYPTSSSPGGGVCNNSGGSCIYKDYLCPAADASNRYTLEGSDCTSYVDFTAYSGSGDIPRCMSGSKVYRCIPIGY